MLIMLLKCNPIRKDLALEEDQELRKAFFSYISHVANQEMKALVLNLALRFPRNAVSPKTLDLFDLKTIASKQQKCAPMLTFMLYTCAGLDDNQANLDDVDWNEAGNSVFDMELGNNTSKRTEPRGRNCKQIATASLCMLCYSRNQLSNVLQMTADYFAFANNASKRMVKVFHQMGIMVVYETVQRAFQVSATAIIEELKAKVWKRRFFLSFDNMNFYD